MIGGSIPAIQLAEAKAASASTSNVKIAKEPARVNVFRLVYGEHAGISRTTRVQAHAQEHPTLRSHFVPDRSMSMYFSGQPQSVSATEPDQNMARNK